MANDLTLPLIASGTTAAGSTPVALATIDKRKTAHPLTFGMAMVAGTGIVLMMIAVGIGVVQGEAANGNLIGLTLVAGLFMLIGGISAWAILTRPFAHFDDINQPKDSGHHAHSASDADHGAHETAIIPADAHGGTVERAITAEGDAALDAVLHGNTPVTIPPRSGH